MAAFLAKLGEIALTQRLADERADRFQSVARDIAQGSTGATCRLKMERCFERFVKRQAEEVFGVPFVKVRPPWLLNLSSGRRLELDCYNEALQCAVEVQGVQHYQFTPKYHRSRADLEAIQVRDALKRKLCEQRGVTLIEVPYWTKRQTVKQHLVSEYLRQTHLRSLRQREQHPSTT